LAEAHVTEFHNVVVWIEVVYFFGHSRTHRRNWHRLGSVERRIDETTGGSATEDNGELMT
jgi:hypothetical protein